MRNRLEEFIKEYRIVKPTLSTGARQTNTLRARAAANRTRRLRAEARRLGIPLRNYMENLEEEREERGERKKERKRSTMKAKQNCKKRGLGVSMNSNQFRTMQKKNGKSKWGNKRTSVKQKWKPSRFLEEQVEYENAELNNEN
jgi:hypothetical protein